MAMGRMNNFTSVLSRGDWDCQFICQEGLSRRSNMVPIRKVLRSRPNHSYSLSVKVQELGVNVEKELERRQVSSERFCLFRVT